MRRLTNDEFQEKLKQLRKNGLDVYTDEEYVSSNDVMTFYCSSGHVWQSVVFNVLNKHSRCPYCTGRLAIVGETDLWTVRPDIASLLLDPSDGYKLKENSHAKIDFVCPNCNTVLKNKLLKNITKRGLQCPVCGDGISYPNKFARTMLKQIIPNTVEYEWQPEWLKPYYYDNYFIYNGKKYVLEMDGGIGHGNVEYKTQQKDTYGIATDKYKDTLAIDHNINVIRIDCNYCNNNRFEYIVDNIINSSLSSVLDLSDIDWGYCDKIARSSMICAVAQMYDKGMTVKEIIADTGYCHTTIHKWLKHASKINMCTYNPDESKLRSRRLVEKSINQYDKFGVFVATYLSQKDAESKTGIKASMINGVLKNRKKSAGGFTWFYADDPSQPDKSKIVFNNTKLMKEAI